MKGILLCSHTILETRDGKKSYDPGPHSPEMARLNKRFVMIHGISSMTNLVGLLVLLGYGFTLGDMLQ